MSDPEKLAGVELRDYLKKLFVEPVLLSTDGAVSDIVLGTTESNPLIRSAAARGAIQFPSGKNADQGYCLKTEGKTIYVAGESGEGILYGVYDLLERYGVVFQISGERLPARGSFSPFKLDVQAAPVFKHRGLLPWDNFLCGMSGYNLEDYKLLIDRAARMRFNMLQFHFYPGLAYFTESLGGAPVNPSFVGSPVDVFNVKGAAAGKECFEGAGTFGCKAYIGAVGNPRAQAEACQKLMREVIRYAHSRGMKTCVGFELMLPPAGDFAWTDKPGGGANLIDPLQQKNVELSVARTHSLMETYPESDYYWLWQSEGRGYLSRAVGREPGAAEMRARNARWAAGPELAGDIDYACLLREVLSRLSPAERARFATGGWSIEHLFPGIAPDFDKEISFASLNNCFPPAAQKQIPCFKVAQQGRPTWMIEWWEFDGVEWFPQFRPGSQELMYRQCVEYGVEGVSLLGWKLSAIEHNVRYLAEFSWNPGLSAAEFYRNYVRKLYGESSEDIARLYTLYDAEDTTIPPATVADNRAMMLGAGWSVLPIPDVPANSTTLNERAWTDIVAATHELIGKQQRLLQIDRSSAATVRRVIPGLDSQGRSWATLLLNRLEFRAIYLESLINLNKSLTEFDTAARARGISAGREAAVPFAVKARDRARDAISKYATCIRNRSDLGVVAQLNEQTWVTIARFCEGLENKKSPYVELDWKALRVTPLWRADFARGPVLQRRDGSTTLAASKNEDGKTVLRAEIGDPERKFHSVLVPCGIIDLDQSPLLDFRIRTTTNAPLAFLFQTSADSSTWYALNLVGKQAGYPAADSLPADSAGTGQWRRVTWNLQKVAREKLKLPASAKITTLVFGTWEKPEKPITVELQDLSVCKRNQLD